MSDTRTGNRTPLPERRYSTGQRDVGLGKIVDNAGPPHKQKREAHSESSTGRADHSEVFGGHWDHDRQRTRNKPSFHPAEVKYEHRQTAFGIRDMALREFETSHTGSWCKKNIECHQTSDFFTDPALSPHANDKDSNGASTGKKKENHSNSKGDCT